MTVALDFKQEEIAQNLFQPTNIQSATDESKCRGDAGAVGRGGCFAFAGATGLPVCKGSRGAPRRGGRLNALPGQLFPGRSGCFQKSAPCLKQIIRTCSSWKKYLIRSKARFQSAFRQGRINPARSAGLTGRILKLAAMRRKWRCCRKNW